MSVRVGKGERESEEGGAGRDPEGKEERKNQIQFTKREEFFSRRSEKCEKPLRKYEIPYERELLCQSWH